MDFIDRARARELVFSYRDRAIAVLGDCMLDQWVWGRVSRISPEAPVPVVDVDYLSFTPGGAANVVNNLCSLGGRVSMLTVVGEDENGSKIIDELSGRGVNVDCVVSDAARPTTTKTRIMANNQQICRTDIERREPLSPDNCKVLREKLQFVLDSASVCVFSDYNKGLLCKDFSEIAVAWKKSGKGLFLGGPKPENIELFRGATLIAFNEKEALSVVRGAVGSNRDVEAAGRSIMEDYGIDAVLITRGDRGMTLFERDEEPFSIPALASEVFDVSGAGDTVLSVVALSMASGATMREAVVLSNFAAAVVVKKVGTATVSVSELMDVIDRQQLAGKL